MITSVKVNVTLKAGSKVWMRGSVINSPIHPDLIREVKQRTGNVEVLSESPSMISQVPSKAPPPTSTSLFMTDNEFVEGKGSNEKREEPKPKKSTPKLVRRKK